MNLQPVTTPTNGNDETPDKVRTRLQGRWLVFVRGVWLVLVIFTLAIFFASLPVYLGQLQTICTGTKGTVCTYLQLSPEQAEVLKGFGLSPGDYAVYTITLLLVLTAVCLVVSMLIVWRRPDDRMALLVALMLVTFGPILAPSIVPANSPMLIPNECLNFLALALLVLVFLLFPSGQFVPRWTRWIFVVCLAVQVPTIFFQNAPFMPKIYADTPGYFVLVGEVAFVVAVQIYRYRRVSSPLQRQQTKWVVFGIAVPMTVYLGLMVLYLIFPALAEPSSPYGAPYQLVLNTSICLLLLIPLSFGFAMLRNRLWDIDVLINRTLVYSTLTASLALVYVCLVIGLQALLSGLISQNNSVAIVISTLAVASLFQPLRQHIQRIIDRRFYRSKYDAAKTVAAYSATLRQEVDLDQLCEQLLAVVQETMQPAHVSLWLRTPERDGKLQARWRVTPPAP